MNKYQIQALRDMGKVALGVIAGIAIFSGIIMLGMSVGDLVGAIGLALIIYCIYQLYLVRVSQLESEDQRNEMEQKYK